MSYARSLWSISIVFTILCFIGVNVEGKTDNTKKSTQLFSQSDTQPEYAPNQIIVKFKADVFDEVRANMDSDKSINQMNLSNSLKRVNREHTAQKIKPLAKNFKQHREKIENLKNKNKQHLTAKENHLLKRIQRAPKNANVPPLDRIYTLTFPEGLTDSELQDILKVYQADPSVEYAELNYTYSLFAIPIDDHYNDQWALNNIGQDFPKSGKYNYQTKLDADIDAPEAWDIQTDTSDIIIAVIDSGIDYTHRDLVNNLWKNLEEENGITGVDDDGNGYVDDIYGVNFINNTGDPLDDNGHGTHCAGIIAAEGNNGLDITGVCWNAKIMGLKDKGPEGGNDTDSMLVDTINAILYAIENGADVISNSYGSDFESQAFQEVIDYAYSQGVIFVASAGNNSSDTEQYPAAYNHVLAVAATDPNDDKATFSNYGDWVDIAAPGVDILSLRANNTYGAPFGDDYTLIVSGTSMACPYVAGACGLLLAYNDTLSPDEVMQIIMESGDPIKEGICVSNARLNINNMLINALTSKGYVNLDANYYSCSSTGLIIVGDIDLAGQNSINITIDSSNGDSETVALNERNPSEGIFIGTIQISEGPVQTNDGYLQVSDSGNITVTYIDADDGSGNPAIKTDTADIDCIVPGIIEMNYSESPIGPDPIISLETTENVLATVSYGAAPSEPTEHEKSRYGSIHNIVLTAVQPLTQYYFKILLQDEAGNVFVDDNNGNWYTFTTNSMVSNIYVPLNYNTIQEAINAAWNGTTIWVSTGEYSGFDFKNKEITVTSTNPNDENTVDMTIINSSITMSTYQNGQLDGFTVNVQGGTGLFCGHGSPTIRNCKFGASSIGINAENSGNYVVKNCEFNNLLYGIFAQKFVSITVKNSIFNGCNTGIYAYIYRAPANITGNIFKYCNRGILIANQRFHTNNVERNLFYQNTKGIQCASIGYLNFANNMLYKNAIGVNLIESVTNSILSSNTIADNTSIGVYMNSETCSDNLITNSIIYGNGDDLDGCVAEYSCVSDINEDQGPGNIDSDPQFVNPSENNYHLLWGSPCIGYGDSSIDYTSQTDIDGDERVIAGWVDMGADEYVLTCEEYNLTKTIAGGTDPVVNVLDVNYFINYVNTYGENFVVGPLNPNYDSRFNIDQTSKAINVLDLNAITNYVNQHKTGDLFVVNCNDL